MAKHRPNYEYFPLIGKNGKPVLDRYGSPVLTLDIKLYAPDGSIFRMPHGGEPDTYTAGKGYKAKPDEAWLAKNAEYERMKAESLRISNAQREIKLKHQELTRREEEKRQVEEIERIEREFAEREAALEGNAAPETPEKPEVAPEQVEEPAPAKAKPKAKPKG